MKRETKRHSGVIYSKGVISQNASGKG